MTQGAKAASDDPLLSGGGFCRCGAYERRRYRGKNPDVRGIARTPGAFIRILDFIAADGYNDIED